jgi:haloalkane dehalogenase
VTVYNGWLEESTLPKLYIHAEPGFFSEGIARATARWPRQETVTVRGHHFVQEDSGPEIGEAIASWLSRI